MQLWPRTKPAEFTPNAAAGIQRALDQLQTGVLKIRPEADKLVIIGRSGADITGKWSDGTDVRRLTGR